MGMPQSIEYEGFALDDAFQLMGPALAENDRVEDAKDVPSCSAALSGRSAEELVAPI